MCVFVCLYVEPVSRSKDCVRSWIKFGSVLCLCAPVSPSVPEMGLGWGGGGGILFEAVPLVEFRYLVFTRMPGERYRWRLRSLLLYLCYVFRALINSVVCWFICFHITPPPSPPFFSPPSSILFFCFSECCLCPSFRIFLFLSLSHCYHLSVSFPSLSVFVSVICPSFCCCLPACLSLTVLISVAVCLPVSVSLSPRMRDTRERSPGIDQIQQFMLSRENGSRAVSDMAPSCFRYGKRFFCALV